MTEGVCHDTQLKLWIPKSFNNSLLSINYIHNVKPLYPLTVPHISVYYRGSVVGVEVSDFSLLGKCAKLRNTDQISFCLFPKSIMNTTLVIQTPKHM